MDMEQMDERREMIDRTEAWIADTLKEIDRLTSLPAKVIVDLKAHEQAIEDEEQMLFLLDRHRTQLIRSRVWTVGDPADQPWLVVTLTVLAILVTLLFVAIVRYV
jgi:hypothetical protein